MSPSAVTSDGHAAIGTNGLKKGHSESKNTPLTWTTFSNVIDGKLETTKETRCGINPATEQNNPSVPVASKEDVDRAMIAAQKAFKPWAAVPYAERQKAVLEFADALEAEKEPFSKFLTQEQGKPASVPHFIISIPCLSNIGTDPICSHGDRYCSGMDEINCLA